MNRKLLVKLIGGDILQPSAMICQCQNNEGVCACVCVCAACVRECVDVLEREKERVKCNAMSIEI